MPTTTLKPKTTKGGSATKASLTNASAEKSRKMLEQMLAEKLSSSTKMPKTMTIKTGATKKSIASAGATKGRKGGRRGGNGSDEAEAGQQGSNPPDEAEAGQQGSNQPEPEAEASSVFPKNIRYGCDCKQEPSGGYRKKMSSKKPMYAKLSKKSSCGVMSSKRPMSTKPRPKSAKK